MKRLLIALLAIVTLAGCSYQSAVVQVTGPNATTLSQGLRLHDIFDDPTKFEYSYDELDDRAYDSYSITCGGATVDDFNIAMQKAKDAGFVEDSAYEGMTQVFSYVGHKDGYQCYMCLVYGCFEMIIRPDNYQELYEQWEAEQEATENS